MNVHSLSNRFTPPPAGKVRWRRSPRGTVVPVPHRKSTNLHSFPAAALRLWPVDQPYLIGVSGGRDSIALLHWLVSCGYLNLHVCHLDHRLRGRASAADARFVAGLSRDFGLP